MQKFLATVNRLRSKILNLNEELDALIINFQEFEHTERIKRNEAKQSDSGEWLTARELARHFKVSPSTIYHWQEQQIIPKSTYFGKRSTRWKLSEVEKHLHNRLSLSRTQNPRSKTKNI